MKNFFKNVPVLVTGGCGFIGSHLATRLVELGAKVTIIDDLSTGSLENIAHIQKEITLITQNILNKDACFQVCQDKKIIFHLAAFISVAQSMQDPEKCYEINVNGTLNMLEAARLNKCNNFIFSSSAAVYGSSNTVCSETDTPTPASAYGYSKLIGELLCAQYAQNFSVNTVILRYFNVWSDCQNALSAHAPVSALFEKCMQHNKPITIYGDGLQTRDYVHVDQVVNANLKLSTIAPRIAGNIYNIASGTSITLLELIQKLKTKFPEYRQEIKFLPAREGDIKFSEANCSKYFNLLKQLTAEQILMVGDKDLDAAHVFHSQELY